jgi:hypothetical protein
MPYLKAKHLRPEYKKIDKELSQNNRKLIYLGNKIKFHSEIDLEDYIESYFDQIFPGLILLKHQHSVQMQRCDLLCCTRSLKQAVIIELKNEEDRYIVSQLIRYRKAILSGKPFAEQIDYSLPVKLIAIAPHFHEDNYTDKEASKFEHDLCFLQFKLENHNNSGKFILSGESYDIPYLIFGLSDTASLTELNISSLTGFAPNFASNLPQEYRQDFIALRTLFLAQPKVKEMVSGSYQKILYGTGDGQNHKKLAEITNTTKGLYLYLWLPTLTKRNIKIPIARFGLVCTQGISPLSRSSTVEWVVCTQDTINIKNKPENSSFSFTRDGMLKWSRSKSYLAQASLGIDNTFLLLIYLLKGITIDDESFHENLQWWESIKTQTPNDLGWFIDLAIKAWNFRIK